MKIYLHKPIKILQFVSCEKIQTCLAQPFLFDHFQQ